MGEEHTCRLAHDGTIACWGANRHGEVGDGTRQMRPLPVTVRGIDDAVQIGVAPERSCARRRAGSVLCWGADFVDERRVHAEPTEVPELAGVVDLAVARGVLCGLRSSGEIVCLGSEHRRNPAGPSGELRGRRVSHAVDLAATDGTLCACDHAGAVTCWGWGGATPGRRVPLPDDAAAQYRLEGMPSRAVRLEASGEAMCMLDSLSVAFCWGGHIVSTDGGIRAAQKSGLHGFGALGPVVDLAFAGWPSDNDCAVLAGGMTVCWPQPMVDLEAEEVPLDVKTVDIPPAYRVESKRLPNGSCALTREGEVYCWGRDERGSLGTGAPLEQPAPVPIPGVTGVVSVVAGEGRACARTKSDAWYCWGGNRPVRAVEAPAGAELLNPRCARHADRLVCYQEPFESPLPDAHLRDVVQLASAREGTSLRSYYALRADGSVHRVEWERGASSGSASRWELRIAARLAGVTDVRRLVTVGSWTCGLRPGKLSCWGDSRADPAAEGIHRADVHSFALPLAYDRVQLTAVHATGYSACISDPHAGRVRCGPNGSTTRQYELAGVVDYDIATEGLQCARVQSQQVGSLHCWSADPRALTGHGSLVPRSTPAAIVGLGDVVGFTLADRSLHSQGAAYVWDRRGRLYGWGSHSSSQLGRVLRRDPHTPVLVSRP